MRSSVSAFGRLSGNTQALRLPLGAVAGRGTRCPAVLPTGPSGETVAASSGQGKTLRRQPCATSRQSRIQPTPCVQPSTRSAASPSPPIATTSSAAKMHTSTSE